MGQIHKEWTAPTNSTMICAKHLQSVPFKHIRDLTRFQLVQSGLHMIKTFAPHPPQGRAQSNGRAEKHGIRHEKLCKIPKRFHSGTKEHWSFKSLAVVVVVVDRFVYNVFQPVSNYALAIAILTRKRRKNGQSRRVWVHETSTSSCLLLVISCTLKGQCQPKSKLK